MRRATRATRNLHLVRADNPAALQTYLGEGFVVVGNAKRQAKIDGQYVDEILIEKWL